MQTIQEVIKGLDRKRIEGGYFYEHSPQFWELRPDDKRTVAEIKMTASKNFQAFLDRLCSMQVKQPEDGKIRILYAHKEIWDTAWYGDIAVSLIRADELLKTEDLSELSSYAYEFTPQEEALGFFVADTKLTQNHLYDVAVSFLHEMSFFGYEQEDREEKLNEILESAKDAEEHPENLVSWSSDEMREELGLPKDEKSAEEEKLDHEVLESISRYNKYCKKIELEKIREALRKGKIF